LCKIKLDETATHIVNIYLPDGPASDSNPQDEPEPNSTGHPMVNINAAFPGTYLKAADLQGRRVTVTISHMKMEKVGDDTKPVIYFQGKERGLVLNKTNANSIQEVGGPDTDHWSGVQIELFEAMVDFQGKTVASIRLRALPRGQQAPNGAPPQQTYAHQGYTPAPGQQQYAPVPQVPPQGGAAAGFNKPYDDEIPFSCEWR
jgi:hypothetical protein